MQATAAVADTNGCLFPNLRAVVFDLDGTLLDSEPLYRDAFLQAAKALGVELPVDLYPKLVGISTRDRRTLLNERLGLDFPFEDFKARYVRLKAEILASEISVRCGAEALIKELFDSGIALAVATSASRPSALRLLDQCRLTPFFQVVVTRDDVQAGKPEPATHQLVAELLGAPPGNCVALEDSPAGLVAAHRAGMLPIMVVDTLPPTPELRRISRAVVRNIPAAGDLVRPALTLRRAESKLRDDRPARRAGGPRKLQIVIIGLTISSSWGNGHATTYRSLVRGLAQAGHTVIFLEHDKPWYRDHRDLANPAYAQTHRYQSIDDLQCNWTSQIRDADLVMVGSYVPEGREVGRFVQRTARGITAFYDIDTPVTLRALTDDTCTYLSREAIQDFDLYYSFTGGPILRVLQQRFGARQVRPLYCSVDLSACHTARMATTWVWDLGYLGTYSPDRQPSIDELLCRPARLRDGGRFVVAGPLYPPEITWPANVERIEHAPPASHPSFYGAQRFTLNITRADMKAWGHSPSVRLFEAAACGTPIISDTWPGLATLFRPGEEILLATCASDVLTILQNFSEDRRQSVAERARARVMADHTGDRRAADLASLVGELLDRRQRGSVSGQR